MEVVAVFSNWKNINCGITERVMGMEAKEEILVKTLSMWWAFWLSPVMYYLTDSAQTPERSILSYFSD